MANKKIQTETSTENTHENKTTKNTIYTKKHNQFSCIYMWYVDVDDDTDDGNDYNQYKIFDVMNLKLFFSLESARLWSQLIVGCKKMKIVLKESFIHLWIIVNNKIKMFVVCFFLDRIGSINRSIDQWNENDQKKKTKIDLFINQISIKKIHKYYKVFVDYLIFYFILFD